MHNTHCPEVPLFNSDNWAHIPKNEFADTLPEGSWISKKECQGIIDFFHVPLRLFDVGQEKQWRDWVLESMNGAISESDVDSLIGPTGEGGRSGSIAPFIAWSWVWHDDYVEATSFLTLIGSMFYDTPQAAYFTEDDPLFQNVAIILEDGREIIRTTSCLWVAASLCKTGLLSRDIFELNGLWDDSPALRDHLRLEFPLDGERAFSSITESEIKSGAGFFAAMERDCPWLIACVLGYLLAQWDAGLSDQLTEKLVSSQLESKNLAMENLANLYRPYLES